MRRTTRSTIAVPAVAMTLAAAATAVAIPPDPRPVEAPGFPPPAWIETGSGDHWMATRFSRWCPSGPAGPCLSEPIPARTPEGGCLLEILSEGPEVAVRPGDRVRFHIPLGAGNVVLETEDGPPQTLAPATIPEWPAVEGAGPARLQASFAQGVVSYRARLVVSEDRTGPRIRAVRVVADDDGTSVRLRLFEPALVTACVGAVSAGRRVPSEVFRRRPGARIDAGSGRYDLGSLPPARYRMTLIARDRAGNTGTVAMGFRV